MAGFFALRAAERGYNKLLSTGPSASYVAGHPDAFITRYSSFNFHEIGPAGRGSDEYASSAMRYLAAPDAVTTCTRITTS
jgi:hypothetical protein